jgi:hypothetical protein
MHWWDRMRTLAVAVDGGVTVALPDAAIDALKGEAGQAQEVFQHVQHDFELAEYEHLTAAMLYEEDHMHDVSLEGRRHINMTKAGFRCYV